MASAAAMFVAALWLAGFHIQITPVAIPPGNHALRSFEIAFNRVQCGIYPYLSSRSDAVRMRFGADPEALKIPASRIPELIAGAEGDYCATVDEPFLNNEGTLGLLLYAGLLLAPNMTLLEMGQLLQVLVLTSLACWLLVALALGLSPLFAVIGLVIALRLEGLLWTYNFFSVYPLLLPMLLLFGSSMVLALRFASTERWRLFLLAIPLAGLTAGLYYDLRTSHTPLILAATLLFFWAARRAIRALTGRRAALVVLAGLGLYLGGLTMAHRTVVPSEAQSAGNAGMYSYHVVAHPLVLSLGLPPNDFAESQGIRWFDEVGLNLAQRVDPNVTYLGPGYEAALWSFYRGLWRDYPRDMLRVYHLKWQTAGREVLGYISKQDSWAYQAIKPILLLGNGLGIMLFWIGLLGWAMHTRRVRPEVAFATALVPIFGLLLLLESAVIYSTWGPIYQSPIVFGLALSILLLYQGILNGVARMIRKPTGDLDSLSQRTISDFGTQWTTYSDTSGLFGSASLLADFIAPFPVERFKGARVADIGAGTGRHARALLEAGAAQVVAVEPSQAVEVIRTQVVPAFPGRVAVLNISGDRLPPSEDLDFAISVGVLHHIPDPAPVIAAVYRALRPGGQFVAWIYGKEGNAAYLRVLGLIRPLSTRLPPRLAAALAWLLDLPLVAYMALCRWLPKAGLPLTDYLNNVLGQLPADKRRLVIYDQIKPHYAKYYTRAEAVALMSAAPFEVEVHSRRGFSWVVIGTKSTDAQP